MFTGVFTAMVTPFRNGNLDEESLQKLIAHQLDHGINGIVPCGTTGEAPTLSHSEYLRVVKITVDTVAKRVPVVAGAGANSTHKAVALTQEVKALGVDATLQVAPYYNKPTQEGICRHFEAIANVGLPVVMYNVPGRTGVNMSPETVARLADLPPVAAIKEASGDLAQMAEIHRLCGDQLTLLSGDDALTLPALSVGGQGVISVLSNLLPNAMIALCRAWQKGEPAGAQKINAQLLPLMGAMFLESNPIPLKTALGEKGLIASPELRLPLCAMSKESRTKLLHIMKETEPCEY
jgi:4-hydroxy-tetrahydrodipicolinate synthase